MKLIKKQNLNKKKRGAALVEYGLLVAGVALTTAAAVSLLGHKTNDMLGVVAAILPSSNAADTGAIRSGRIISTADDGNGIGLDFDPSSTDTLGTVYGNGIEGALNDTQGNN